MTRRKDDCPYHNDSADYYADAQPSPMQKRVAFVIIALCLALIALFSLGCYGTAIDTRSITADEVTITQHTPWSQLTITAKGWKSDVKGQPLSPASAVSREKEIEAHVNGVVGAGAGDSLPGTGAGHGGPAVSVVPLETPVPGSPSTPK